MNPAESTIDFYKNIFYTYGEQKLPFLVNSSLSKLLFLGRYKNLPPIEDIPPEEQKEMFLYACNLFPNKSKEEIDEAIKMIYTIGNLL